MANEIIKGMGFHHSALASPCFEESLKFFTEGLGMKYFTGWGEGNGRIAMLDMGDGGILELFACGSKEASIAPKFIHLAFKVDDVEAAYATALAAGAKEKSAPKVVPLNAEPNKVTIMCAFVYGPGGEELEFFKFL